MIPVVGWSGARRCAIARLSFGIPVQYSFYTVFVLCVSEFHNVMDEWGGGQRD